MTIGGEVTGNRLPVHAETLNDYLDYFRALKKDKGWSNEKLQQDFFKARVSPGTLKKYLRREIPAGPQDETVACFRDAWKQARRETHRLHRQYQENLACWDLEAPSEREFNRYAGAYVFWRHGRFGMVSGSVSIERHADADIPCWRQEHTQTTGERTAITRNFSFLGAIYWRRHNLHVLNVAQGEVRDLLLRCGGDPSIEPIVGTFLTEEFDANRRPFAGAVLLLRKGWYDANRSIVTADWIHSHLTNAAPIGVDGRQALFFH